MFLWYCMDFSGGSYLKSLFVSRITSLEKSVYLFNALVLINVVCFDRFLGFSEWVSFVCWENLHLCRWSRSPAVIYSEIVHILCFGMRSNLIWNLAHLNALGRKNTLIFAWSSCRGPHHADHCHLLPFFDIENRKLIENLSCIDASERTYPDFFPLGFAHSDHRCLLMIFVTNKTENWLKFERASLLQYVCIQILPFGLAQQDRPYLLMICVWTCTKIQPEIDGFSSLQYVRIPSFTHGLSHDDQRICWYLLFAYTWYEIPLIWPNMSSRQLVCIPLVLLTRTKAVTWWLRLACTLSRPEFTSWLARAYVSPCFPFVLLTTTSASADTSFLHVPGMKSP